MDALAAIDLNLLVALDHLLEARSVTGAARRAGTTQPSMSRTLARLREVFADPLLVATGRGMEATERGRELAPRVHDALASIRRVLAPQAAFEPARDRAVFRIAASDLATSTVLRPALGILRREAPGITLRIESAGPASIEAIAQGEIDLGIGPRASIEGVEQLVFRLLTTDRFVCVVRKNHPVARGKLTLARYLALEHIVISRGTPGISPIHAALQRRGESRRVVLTVPTFMEAAMLVASSDLAAALPERLVRAPGFSLCARELPFACEEFSLYLAFHPRAVTDRRHRWVRERIAESVRAQASAH
jgi:DNA-binding transcriptional LysR family regulator